MSLPRPVSPPRPAPARPGRPSPSPRPAFRGRRPPQPPIHSPYKVWRLCSVRSAGRPTASTSARLRPIGSTWAPVARTWAPVGWTWAPVGSTCKRARPQEQGLGPAVLSPFDPARPRQVGRAGRADRAGRAATQAPRSCRRGAMRPLCSPSAPLPVHHTKYGRRNTGADSGREPRSRPRLHPRVHLRLHGRAPAPCPSACTCACTGGRLPRAPAPAPASTPTGTGECLPPLRARLPCERHSVPASYVMRLQRHRSPQLRY